MTSISALLILIVDVVVVSLTTHIHLLALRSAGQLVNVSRLVVTSLFAVSDCVPDVISVKVFASNLNGKEYYLASW